MFTELERILLHSLLEDHLHLLRAEICKDDTLPGQRYANEQQCLAIENIQEKIKELTDFYESFKATEITFKRRL